jgi:copper(I)-binding protein
MDMRRRPMMVGVLLTGIALALSAVPWPASPQTSSIRIDNAWARRAAMAPGGPGAGAAAANGAVYATISNRGEAADAVVSAASDAARVVELHETKNEGGVMSMRPITKMSVPAGGRLELKPGSYHVMLLGLTRDLKPGDRIKVTLTFERAGAMTIDVPVQ